MLFIKFLDGLVVVKKPYLMQTARLALRLGQPTCIEVIICVYNLANDEALTCKIHSTDFMIQLCAINDFRLHRISYNYRL